LDSITSSTYERKDEILRSLIRQSTQNQVTTPSLENLNYKGLQTARLKNDPVYTVMELEDDENNINDCYKNVIPQSLKSQFKAKTSWFLSKLWGEIALRVSFKKEQSFAGNERLDEHIEWFQN